MYNFRITDPYFLPHSGCDIELSLNPGELVMLVGENGIGKTTLVRRFWEAASVPMTLVEQKPLDVFYDRSLKKIKEVFLSSREGKISPEFFLELWKKFGLEQKENRLHSSLSGGEGQALKICLGLSLASDLYILDEPSQFLDQTMKKVLSEVISDLIKNKKSVLVIEHDFDWHKLPTTFIQIGMEEGTLKRTKTWTT